MTIEETAKILTLIMSAYPNYKPVSAEANVTMMQKLMSDISYKDCEIAVISYIRTDTSGFAPSIGQIIAEIEKLKEMTNTPLNEMSAWSMVRKAISNSTYNYKEEFKKLPKVIQMSLGDADVLNKWATDDNFNESVVMSDFQRSFRVCQQRQRHLDMLPQSVKDNLLEQAKQIGIGVANE